MELRHLVIWVTEIAVLAAGVGVLTGWLMDTKWGTESLLNSKPRRNDMPIFVLLALFFLWFAGCGLGMHLIRSIRPNINDEQSALAENMVLLVWGGFIALISFLLAKRYFARGLRGFGLRLRTAGKDFYWAAVNLISIWPIIFAILYITVQAGKLIYGPDFSVTKHDELKLLNQFSGPWLVIIIILVTVVIAPVVEEILFRGMLQTMIRAYTGSAWIAIFFTSAMFATIHIANPAHIPALFVLALCLGYAYEKSGSLLRSIFIHAMFNATSVVATLLLKWQG